METVVRIHSESEYNEILQQAVVVSPWGHINHLITKFGDDDNAILYYAEENVQKGWRLKGLQNL